MCVYVLSVAEYTLLPKVSDFHKNCSLVQQSVVKFDRSNKFDLCYYGTNEFKCNFEKGK